MRFPGSPYSLREFAGMVWRRFSPVPPWGNAPVARHLDRHPHRAPDRWIGFVGDLCPLDGRDARYAEAVHAFFDDCALLVGNFEGVLTERRGRPFRLKHTPSVFDAMARLKPLRQWVVSLANNHAADFGSPALRTTTAHLDRRGIRWLGTREHPTLTVPEAGLALAAWTWWSNRRTTLLSRRDPGAPKAASAPLVRVALPHWGYEHERRPRSNQRHRLPLNYELVAGHHSHLPQPLEDVTDGPLVAWSLGNFLTAETLPVLGEGALLKIGLAHPPDAPPVVAEARYQAVRLDRTAPHQCRVHPRSSGTE
jgi:hypothetical protein